MSNTARESDGDLVIPRVIVTDPASVALQAIQDTLALWEGSWFMDLNAGFPWLQSVLGVPNPSITQAKGLLTQAILYCPYVIAVQVQISFNSALRAFSWSFQATLNTGQILLGGSNTAFSVQNAPAPGGAN